MSEPVDDSTGTKVAALLRDAIVRGELKQGTPLRESPLSDKLGVSRRSVREALFALEAQGIVRHERNRGAFVRTLQRDDIEDLYRVRHLMESQGARRAGHTERDRLDNLHRAFDSLVDGSATRTASEIALLDLKFHGAVIGLAGSSRLDSFYTQLSAEMWFAVSILRNDEELDDSSAEQIYRDHAPIYKSLVSGDTYEAQLAIAEHIDMNRTRMIALLWNAS